MTDVTHAELAADDGSVLVGHIFDATGAEARTVQDKLREGVSLLDFIPDTLHADIYDGSSTTDLSAYFDAALAYVEGLPGGGEIYIPRGAYTMRMDLSRISGAPVPRVTLRGAGRGATIIQPTDTDDIVLNMLGRSTVTVRDLTIRAAAWRAQCGIYLARESASPNANNNKFLNLTVEGNYSIACVVSMSAESSLWLDCRIAPTVDAEAGGARTGFVTGSNPATYPVTVPAGTAVVGPNSDNRMIACEVYAPGDDARLLILSESAAWLFSGCGFIAGTAQRVRLISYRNPNVSGIFTGPVQFRDCQYEVFTPFGVTFPDNHIHYLDATGLTFWYGISSSGGYAVVEDVVPFLDYDRSVTTNQPLLGGSILEMPKLPPGLVSGLPLYAFGFIDSRVDWRGRDINGVVAVLGFSARTPIDATEPLIAQLVSWDAPVYADVLPTAGTFAKGQRVFRSSGTSIAAGDVESWICTAAGTMGVLNGGATTATAAGGTNQITVSSATGLEVGQLIAVAGAGTHRIARIRGTTVHLTDNISAVSGAAVSFPAAAFEPIGVIGLAAAQANSTAASVADLKTDFNALLAKLRAGKVIAT